MNVTEEILKNHLIYGASDNTAPGGVASSRSLNYTNGPSITRPDNIRLSSIPYTLKYQDSVGLFGAENYFVKVTVVADLDYANACFEEIYWSCALMYDADEITNYYQKAIVDESLDPIPVNSYEPVEINLSVNRKANAYISVDLKNLKTGNIYVDNWLDTRLYTADREEHPYDKMYIRSNDFFYLGVHARNTRSLPYNIECIVGNEYKSSEELTDNDRQFIARRIS